MLGMWELGEYKDRFHKFLTSNHNMSKITANAISYKSTKIFGINQPEK